MIRRLFYVLLFMAMIPFIIIEILIRFFVLIIEWLVFGTTKTLDEVYIFNFLIRFEEDYI